MSAMNNAIACPSDEELIPMMVGESADTGIASHLHSCSACQRRLELFKSDLHALRGTIKMKPVSVPPSRPARIGKYLVVGSLDSGGQANVYRAIHPTLDKELAIKLSRHAVGRLSDHRPLLVAEGKLLAKLEHPGLARIYDLDFHDDLPFLAMEYVRGPNLRKFAADSPVPPRTAARLVAEVARALAVVHQHGVVHQDVKPQNILIDETGRARLIDFGMARLRHAWDDSGECASGGTPAFMAPEQARSEDAAIGPRSDLFALGGVLYFLLTGKPPFLGETVADTLKLARGCEFDRTALDQPGIPHRLRDICLKAMAPTPNERYPRGEDLADDLERYLTRPQQLRRLASISTAAVVLVGIGIGLWASGQRSGVVVPGAPKDTRPALEMVISRGGQSLDLANALPLVPESDTVQVVARIPPAQHAVLVHVNGNGKVKLLPFRKSPATGHTTLLFPATEDTRQAFERDVPGTEVVLVCSAEDPAAFDQIEELVQARLGRLPQMPAGAKPVWLTPEEVPLQSRSTFGEGKVEPIATVESRLNDLRQSLLNRTPKLSLFRGVAYPRP
ncbi:MAG: hypothetical protein C0467_20395 [Planctomycetaceae bacterium]|nr:hypothetical protein [Planctomycetaceae bacterium]